MPVTKRALLLTLVCAPVAAGAEPVLHEYVAPPGSRAAPTDSMPAEIRVEDRTLPRPPSRPAPAPGERILGGPDTRTDRIAPDRTTTHDGVLRYRAEFNPSVVPFKRMTAVDAVGPGYALRVRNTALRPVRVTRIPASPDRDMFWGSLVLDAQGGKPVPIPSVAPEARILSYTATPNTRVRFFRDSADNFWVRAEHRGRLRLVFLTDAPRRYFAPTIPPTVRASDVPPSLRPALPEPARRAAQRVIQQIGVEPGSTLLRQLDRLTAYFRNFRAGPLPRITGDTYLDIALSQRGVCRHRSFAFVVTAQALGIPARYVQNEAHAFTEVFVPRMGWARIDLGGASSELQVLGAKEKAVHNPGPDPFPSPSRYAGGYSRLNRNVSGVRPAQRLRRRGRRVALGSYDRSSRPSPGRATGGGASGTPAATGGSGPATAAGQDPPAPAEPPPPAREPTSISLYTHTRSAFRGEQVSVWGRVASGADGVSGLRVEIYLSRDGRVSDALLGATVSGEDGRFSVALPVPAGVRVGRYRIFAATPGDPRHEASISR